MDCKEIIYLLKKGYAFTHVFTDNTTFTQKEKTINNFKYTHFVAVDVDDSVVDMNEYISSLEYTPTFAYTTFSNNKEGKGYRFRLVYVVNNKITSKERYTDVYRHFTNKLNLKDNCMQSVAQQCFGTTQDADTFISNKVYDLNSIESYKVNVSNTKECNSKCISIEEGNIIQLVLHSQESNNTLYNKDFLNDYYSLSYKDFLEKYKDVYPFFYSTKLDTVDDDTPYILLPDNYLEIKRYWLVEKDIDDNNNEIHKRSKVRKLKNGQNRRKKLFINAILRRFMLPELTPEYLLIMLVYELYFYIDNTDDKITKKDLFEICNNAIKADLDNYKQLSVQKHSKFIVNDNYCIKYNVNRKQARNIAKKMLNYEEIGNLYDCSLTDKENLQIMKDAGLDISLRTLKNFKKDNGLTKPYKVNVSNTKECNSKCISIEEGNIIQLVLHSQESNNKEYNKNSIEMENEIWKDIEGYEGLYMVSNFGRIKSLHRNGKIMRLYNSTYGYLRVHLSKNKEGKHYFVHRLVAKAFIPNDNNFPIINHKDENKKNNSVDNLEWCNYQYNNTYNSLVERRRLKTDYELIAQKLSKKVFQYTKDGELVKIWNSTAECGRNGYFQNAIANCCNGKCKTHKGYIWSYENKNNKEENDMEKTKLINNIETLYNKYSNIKDETEAKEKYLLFTQYLQKHSTLLTNTEYNNYLKKIQEKKDYIVAMYTQDFSVFANYCTTHNVVNFS